MTDPLARWEAHTDVLKLTEDQLAALLDLRQRATRGSGSSADLRHYRRVRIRGALWNPAEIRDPTGATRKFKVYPVDISANGMCFLVGMFVHQGSQCTITLHLPDGELVPVEGKAMRCNLLKGRAHEVGIAFAQIFDMGWLHTGPAPSLSPLAHHPEKDVRNDMAETNVAHNGTPAVVRANGAIAKHESLFLSATAKEIKSLADRLETMSEVAARLKTISEALLEPSPSADAVPAK